MPMRMMRRYRTSAGRALGVAALGALLSGCATKGDIRALQTEVREELRAQAARQDSLMTLLRRESMSTQDTLRTQADQLVDFRGDITRLLQQLTQGQARLEALVGENQRQTAAIRNQLAGGGVAVAGAAAAGAAAGVGAAGPGNETLVGVGGGNADQLYGVARDQHQRGSLSAAQQAYEQFLEDYPNDPRAADAHFYLADILEQQNRPDDALEAFREIPTLYPTASRVPDALFRMARLQLDMGDSDDARATLERIVNTYPDSAVAFLARDMLEDLR
jgi:tol-pal system protein YbgF